MADAGRSRRAHLRAGAAALSGLVAGCVSAASDPPVTLLVAGSLADAVENGLRDAVDTPLRVEARGSVEAARLVSEERRRPDVVSLADTELFDAHLDAAWYATFATNAVVLAYDPDSPGGRAVARAAPDDWFRPLVDGDVSVGRTDPDLDPLGYRTLFALDLAADHHDTAVDLRSAVPERDQVYPETQLLSRFETGAVDAIFCYRSMAVDRGYPHVTLPSAVDLSDPARSDRYGRVGYTLPSGRRVTGDAIAYGATVLNRADRPDVRRVFDAHVNGSYLADHGFVVGDDHPRIHGDAPADVA